MRKLGESLRMKEQSLKSEFRETELQEKNVNDRLIYMIWKKIILMEEQQQRKCSIRRNRGAFSSMYYRN